MKKLIEKMEFDSLTGLPMVEDVRGNLHVLDWANTVNCHKFTNIFLQTDLKNGNWASSTAFNRIPDSVHQGYYLIYTVPQGHEFRLDFIVATAFQRGADHGITILGMYVNDEYYLGVPFFRDFTRDIALPFKAGDKIEFKLKPGAKNTDFGMIAGGHLIKKE